MGFDVISNSAEETIELGRKVGSQLKGGDVIAVCGALGSGKTHLIKGIAAGAGTIDQRRVNSPTFVIVNEYTGGSSRLDIYHIDAYRLGSIAEVQKTHIQYFIPLSFQPDLSIFKTGSVGMCCWSCS